MTGESPKIPRTIENSREKDDTILDPENEDDLERIEEMNLDINTDEYANYFQMDYEPKVLITYTDNPLQVYCLKIIVFILPVFFKLYTVIRNFNIGLYG